MEYMSTFLSEFASSKTLTLAVTASLIDTSTGEIVWTGEASHSEPLTSSGPSTDAAIAEQQAMDLAIRPIVQKLTASLRDAKLFS